MSEHVISLTAPVVLAHPALDQPKAFKGEDASKAKYSANLVFPAGHPDLSIIKTTMLKTAKAKWPERNFSTNFEWPLKSGDTLANRRQEKAGKDDGAYQRGKFVLIARSKYQPSLSILEGGQIKMIEGPAISGLKQRWFYFGVEVLAQLNFSAYTGVGRNPDGICAYINMILSLGKGERIAGAGIDPREAFKGYVGAMSGDDPTVGMTDQGTGIGDGLPY